MMGAISAIYVCYLIYFSQQPSEVGAIIHYFLDEEAEAQKLTNLLKFIQLIRGGAWIWTQAALLQSQCLPTVFDRLRQMWFYSVARVL